MLHRLAKCPSVLLLLALALPFIGCVRDRTTFTTAGLTINTVDAAMNGWGDWVRAGKASPAQEAEVRKAYEGYLDSVRLFERAVEASYADPEASQQGVTFALGIVAGSSTEIITLIENLTGK